MPKKIDLIGKKFGKLTILSKSDSIFGGITTKRYWGAWNCKCDCGNYIKVKTVHLNRGQVKSCGCSKTEGKSALKSGDKINRLTLLEFLSGKWKCLCDCGNIVTISTDKINNGNTKSCGCLKSEISSKNSEKLISGRRKFEPRIASARRVWKNTYSYRDKNCIEFEDFLKISQQNCFYCGVEPHTRYNYFNTISSNSSQKAKNEGLFIYNGLDRIDSSKSHTLENVVSCCYNCNRAKNNRTSTDFLLWTKSLKPVPINDLQIGIIHLPANSYLSTSIKCIFKSGYNDGNLKIEEFYFLSQQPCYYCNALPNNIFNHAKTDKKSTQKAKNCGDFIYNGLDRMNPNQGHDKNNVVSCCKYCNFAKSNMSLLEFQTWINRIKKYQTEKRGD